MSLSVKDGGLPPDSVVQDDDEILADSERLVARHHDPGWGAMVRVALAPCSPFSVTPELMRRTAELAERLDVRLHTHLAEDPDEDRFAESAFGKRTIEHFEDVGLAELALLGGPLHLPEPGGGPPAGPGRRRGGPLPVLEHDDRRRGPGPGGRAAGGRLAGRAGLRRLGVHRPRLALDGGQRRASPGTARGGPTAMGARQALEIATRGSAGCLGRGGEIGQLSVGAAGDLVCWPLEGLAFAGALTDPVEAWLRCGPVQARHTVVAGRPVVARRERCGRRHRGRPGPASQDRRPPAGGERRVKFPPFDYVRAGSVAEAVGYLAGDEDARVLAGGQSLLPLMAMRLARPSVLVDIGSLDLAGVELEGGVLRLGGLVRHSTLVDDPSVQAHAPLLAAGAAHVGHPAIRNRGTLAGSLAHADPAAELPAVTVALDARVTVDGPSGRRSLPAAELIDGYFTNNLETGEVITAIEVPVGAPGQGAAFCEWAPRFADFAEVGVGVAVEPGRRRRLHRGRRPRRAGSERPPNSSAGVWRKCSSARPNQRRRSWWRQPGSGPTSPSGPAPTRTRPSSPGSLPPGRACMAVTP